MSKNDLPFRDWNWRVNTILESHDEVVVVVGEGGGLCLGGGICAITLASCDALHTLHIILRRFQNESLDSA